MSEKIMSKDTFSKDTFSKDEFSIKIEKTDPKTCRLILEGRITSVTSNMLNRRLDEIYKDYKCIILNMQAVSFLSSGGIRVLLMYFKILKGNGGSFYIEKPSENVKNVLGLVALDEMLLR